MQNAVAGGDTDIADIRRLPDQTRQQDIQLLCF